MTPESPDQIPVSASDAERIDKVVRLSRLLDIYGELLTDRQRDFLHLHCDEDMSFSEIAEEYGVSRQAVHDAAKHGIESLEHYESKLKLAETETTAKAADATPSAPAVEESIKRLRDVYDRLRRSGGIIYDASSLTREIGEIIGDLSRQTSEPDQEYPTQR